MRRDVRLGQGLPIGNRRVNPRVHPRTLARDLGKETQLIDRACAFADQARLGESRLGVRSRDERITDGEDFVADALEKCRPRVACGLAKRLKRFVGQPQSRVHVELVRHVERRLEVRAVERTPGPERVCPGDLAIADQRMAVK